MQKFDTEEVRGSIPLVPTIFFNDLPVFTISVIRQIVLILC